MNLEIKVDDIWLDQQPGVSHPWFKVTGYDEKSGIILGYRFPNPSPPGQATKKFIEEHPRLGKPDVSDITYFKQWCIQ